MVLAGEGHENKTYELSGKLLTHDELAKSIAEALGHEVPVQHVDDAGYAEAMRGTGAPEPVVSFLVAIQSGIREGGLDVASNDLETLLGHPATPLVDAIRGIVKELQG